MPSVNVGRIAPYLRPAQVGIGETFIPASAPALPPHRHRFAQLHLVLDGNYVENSRGADFSLGPGSALFRPPQELHSNRFGNAAVHGLLMDLEPSVASRLLPGLDISAPSYFPAHTFDDMCRWFARESRQHAAERYTVLQAMALALAARMSRHARTSAAGIPPCVGQAVAIIRKRYSENLRLAALSQELGLSPARLATAFRRYLSQSVGEFLTEVRLQEAGAAILDRKAPLSAIAVSCGFYDQAHLTRAFRRRYGTTPGELRLRGR